MTPKAGAAPFAGERFARSRVEGKADSQVTIESLPDRRAARGRPQSSWRPPESPLEAAVGLAGHDSSRPPRPTSQMLGVGPDGSILSLRQVVADEPLSDGDADDPPGDEPSGSGTAPT